MTDHARHPNPGDLLVTLLCEGKVVDTQVASSPEEAALQAVTLIWHIGELDIGDSLTVTAADPGGDAPLVPDAPL
jgi:hypothetical protein